MIFSKDMDNLKIYKRPMYLPTLETDKTAPNKKTESVIYLLTPSRNSSVSLMKHPMTVNRTRYQSYYIEKDLTYFINSKVLMSDNLDESAYITEGSIFDNLIISGFEKDTAIIKQSLTPDIYADLVKQLKCYDEIPVLNIIVGEFPERDGFFCMRFNTMNDKQYIYVDIPRFVGGVDTTESSVYQIYIQRVFNFIVKALVINKFRDTVNTGIPAIVADAITGAETKEGNWGRYLFSKDYQEDSDYVTVIDMNFSTFWKLVEVNDYKAILNLIRTKFPEATIDDIIFGNPVTYEAATPITMDNLGDKFKYATTTKFKRKISTTLNSIKRSLEKIGTSFQITMNLPMVGSSSIGASSESVSDDVLNGLIEGEDYIPLGEGVVMFLSEDAKYDVQLKKLLYKDRIRKTSQIQAINKQIKKDVPEIKYAFPELKNYYKKNLFVDLYFYNQTFFKNNTWYQKKGFDLYLDLLNRLVNDSRIEAAGYRKKTIFIPINDWNRKDASRMWLYRESINPVSIIYELMMRNPQKVKQTFKDTDIIFFGESSIFKMNFMEMKDNTEIKKLANKFRNFIVKITSNERFDPTDVDVDTSTTMSPEAIKADLYDKFETTQGIDLTGKELQNKNQVKDLTNAINKANGYKDSQKVKEEEIAKSVYDYNSIVDKKNPPKEEKKEDETKGVSIGQDPQKAEEFDDDLAAIATKFSAYADKMPDTDAAIDSMELDVDLKDIINQIDAEADPGIKLSTTRAARFNKLADEFLNKKVNDISVKDILSKNQSQNTIEPISLNIATPNDDWNNLTYVNFDKNYDLDADIVKCFNHFTTTSLPMGIIDMTTEDNSTSEDRIKTYITKYEDFNGKRHTIRLDIPIPIDNRFLLRGNAKTIATQFLNMPILKTDLGTAQIISNYQKIYVRRYNDGNGRSNPVASALIKALTKYEGRKLKISFGDNTKICNKYQLPIDYIDIASKINSIESKNVKIYFNQDEIRADYPGQIYENKGVPYGVMKSSESGELNILYYDDNTHSMIAQSIIDVIYSEDKEFFELYSSIKPSVATTYSRCKILGTLIPLIVVVAYVDGLEKVLNKAKITYHWTDKLKAEDRFKNNDWIKFSDGYLVYELNYSACMLLGGLKDCPTDMYSISDVNNKRMYIEFLDLFGGRSRADGIDNFNDCLIDPITKEVMEYYNLPTEFVEVLLYTNALLADNKFIRHTDTSSRRIRRAEMVAAYTYEALSEAYGAWAIQIKRGRKDAEFKVKQSAVIDKLLQSPISQDDSVNNALGAIEETNNISFKGKAGLNKDRAYSLDKRTYDDSMLNVLGASTAFSGNVGIGRISTINMNVDNARGYIKQIDSDTSKMNTANTLTATEAMIPFEVNRDDNTRVSMSFVQTAKHQVRTEKSDPLLVTSGIDEALPYITTDTFAFKAKKSGKILEIKPDEYVFIEYDDGTKDYVSLKEEIKKNSDGGYFVPVQLIIDPKLKEGSKIKANQIIAYDSKSFGNNLGESDNIAYLAGDLTKVAIINTDEGFEDSGVVTEKLSKELTTQVIYEFDHIVEKDAIVYSMAKIGDYVNVGDPLFIWQDSYEDEDASVILRVMGQNAIETSELGRKTIKSETTGTVVGIKIYRTCDFDGMSPDVKKIVKQYEAPIVELKKKFDEQGISSTTLPATYPLPAVGKLKKADDALYIAFYVQHDDVVGVGDKIVYFAANKAVIRTVIPDELSPYTDFRPNEQVSAFVSVVSINKRMVTSTLVNGALNKLMIELDRKCKGMAGIPFDDSTI